MKFCTGIEYKNNLKFYVGHCTLYEELLIWRQRETSEKLNIVGICNYR